MSRRKRPVVFGVVESQRGSIGGVIRDGKAVLPFVFNPNCPIVLTGKLASEALVRETWQKAVKPYAHVWIGRIITLKAEKAVARLTVICLQGGGYIVICQHRRKDGKYVERFRQMDSLIGWWLEVGQRDLFIRENGDVVIPMTLSSLIEAAQLSRRLHQTHQHWGKMTLYEVMSHAMTGW